jgi:acetyl-CoA synthetase
LIQKERLFPFDYIIFKTCQDMITLKNKTTHHLLDYEKVHATFSWGTVARELDGLPNGKGLNIAHEAVDRHAQTRLKNTVALRFILKNNHLQEFTYADLQKQTSKFANVLQKLKIQKGERVFSFAGRIPELYITALGTLKYTAVFCPLFSVYGPEPVYQRLSKGDATVLVTTSLLFENKIKQILEKLPSLRYIILTDATDHVSEKIRSFSKLMDKAETDFTIPQTNLEDPALLHFTSGTTGMPKGVLHVHKAVLTHYITGKYVLDFHEGDRYWCTADPGWVTGTSYGIIAPLLHGITNIIDEAEFDATRWYSLLDTHKINIWYTAPTAIRRLMRMDIKPKNIYNLENLKLILSVGEPLHKEAVIWGQENFDVPILDNWWQTETGGIMIANYPSMVVKPGSMGKPLPGIEIALAAINDNQLTLITQPEVQGHLVLKKGFPSLFRGYIHEEERYKKCFIGDWYLSGDLAKKDADGYFWFIGRADDIIKTSGHMVGPFEVESTLMRHPNVAEAAVIGIPEPSIGELVKAFVVLKAGIASTVDTKMDIMAFVRREMGPAVAPKEIEFIENIPKTRSGKILRRLLKARELGLPEGDISTLESS